MDMEKLDRLTKLLAAMEMFNKFPTMFNDLNAIAMKEAKELGKELGADVDKTSPTSAPMREISTANPTGRSA